jgi:hypothetical protein
VTTPIAVAFACNLLAVVLVALFGLTYFLRKEFMPYHAQALGKAWPAVEPAVRVLVLALMRAIGGLCFAVVILEIFVLALPFRQGAGWAYLAVPTAGLVVTAASVYGMADPSFWPLCSSPYSNELAPSKRR